MSNNELALEWATKHGKLAGKAIGAACSIEAIVITYGQDMPERVVANLKKIVNDLHTATSN